MTFISRPNCRLGRAVTYTTVALFLLQALVPAGFMPAPLSKGQFVQLCPTGLTPELMQVFHPGHSSSLSDPHAGHHAGHHQGAAQIAHSSPAHSTRAEHSTQTEHSSHDDQMSWRADCPFGAVAPLDYAARLALTTYIPTQPPAEFSVYRPRTTTRTVSYLTPPSRAPPKVVS